MKEIAKGKCKACGKNFKYKRGVGVQSKSYIRTTCGALQCRKRLVCVYEQRATLWLPDFFKK